MASALSVPTLFCPFPSRLNAHAEEADDHTLDWLADHDLLSAHDYEHFRGYRCGWLAARAYPNADLDALTIASDWVGWLCALDNQCDETGVGTRPAQLTRVLAQLLEILRSPAVAAPEDHDGPLEAGLADLQRRMSRRSTPGWMAQFAHDVDGFFDALVWEATHRARGTTPTVDDYLAMRPRSSAMDHCVDLIGLVEGLEMAADVRSSPAMESLTSKAINVVCWANDLVSLERELATGTPHNLVVVIQRERGCSLEAARQLVIDMHDAEIRSFIDVQTRFTSEGPLGPEVEAYLLGLRCWMRGNLEWSSETERYRSGSWQER